MANLRTTRTAEGGLLGIAAHPEFSTHRQFYVYVTTDASGRLREVLMGPDGHLYVTTRNRDGRGACVPRKDLILRLKR